MKVILSKLWNNNVIKEIFYLINAFFTVTMTWKNGSILTIFLLLFLSSTLDFSTLKYQHINIGKYETNHPINILYVKNNKNKYQLHGIVERKVVRIICWNYSEILVGWKMTYFDIQQILVLTAPKRKVKLYNV